MTESLHTLLSSLAEATASSDAGAREFMLMFLGHRDELMERIRQPVLRDDPALPLPPGRLAAGSSEQLALAS